MKLPLFKSELLKRILFTFILLVVIFVLITSSIYITISRQIYSDIKTSELLPKANTLAALMKSYVVGDITFDYFSYLTIIIGLNLELNLHNMEYRP